MALTLASIGWWCALSTCYGESIKEVVPFSWATEEFLARRIMTSSRVAVEIPEGNTVKMENGNTYRADEFSDP